MIGLFATTVISQPRRPHHPLHPSTSNRTWQSSIYSPWYNSQIEDDSNIASLWKPSSKDKKVGILCTKNYETELRQHFTICMWSDQLVREIKESWLNNRRSRQRHRCRSNSRPNCGGSSETIQSVGAHFMRTKADV